MRPRGPRRLRKPHVRGELRAVIDETIALFHRVRFVAEEIYGAQGRSTARRGVLRGLARFGPQTVPQLARARSVTRQHVQEVADALVGLGLAQWLLNPRHRRSQLLKVTPRGAALVLEMDRVDDRVLHAAGGHLPRAELAVAVKTLRALRESFELSARWRAVL